MSFSDVIMTIGKHVAAFIEKEFPETYAQSGIVLGGMPIGKLKQAHCSGPDVNLRHCGERICTSL